MLCSKPSSEPFNQPATPPSSHTDEHSDEVLYRTEQRGYKLGFDRGYIGRERTPSLHEATCARNITLYFLSQWKNVEHPDGTPCLQQCGRKKSLVPCLNAARNTRWNFWFLCGSQPWPKEEHNLTGFKAVHVKTEAKSREGTPVYMLQLEQ